MSMQNENGGNLNIPIPGRQGAGDLDHGEPGSLEYERFQLVSANIIIFLTHLNPIRSLGGGGGVLIGGGNEHGVLVPYSLYDQQAWEIIDINMRNRHNHLIACFLRDLIHANNANTLDELQVIHAEFDQHVNAYRNFMEDLRTMVNNNNQMNQVQHAQDPALQNNGQITVFFNGIGRQEQYLQQDLNNLNNVSTI